MYRLLSRFLKAGVVLLALSAGAAADEYPDKPIRLIIPFPPGGSNDVVGRLVARHLSDVLGQQVYVDNRGGAGGTIGTDIAAKATPDGYTLLVISLAHAVNPWLYKLTYDPIKSFTPVAIFGSGTNVLAVNPELPVNSVQELIALAKQKPGELQYASAGIGSFQHLGGELFKLMAGVDIVHVPFRGGGPAMVDVMGGHTKIIFSSLIRRRPTSSPASSRRWRPAAPNAIRCCPMCRRLRNQACPDTRPIIGGACSLPPARRRRSWKNSTKPFRPRSMLPNCKINSRRREPRS